MAPTGNSNQWLVGIRSGDWKLIIETNNRESIQRDPFALFNLADNPTEDETENLIDAAEQQIRIPSKDFPFKQIDP